MGYAVKSSVEAARVEVDRAIGDAPSIGGAAVNGANGGIDNRTRLHPLLPDVVDSWPVRGEGGVPLVPGVSVYHPAVAA